MAINRKHWGKITAIEDALRKSEVVFVAPANSTPPTPGEPVDTSVYTGVGGIADGGVTWAQNLEEGDSLEGYNVSELDRSDPTISPTLTIPVVQISTPEVARLAYHSSDITETPDGGMTVKLSERLPANVDLVFEGKGFDDGVERTIVRVYFRDARFRSRGDIVFTKDSIASMEIVYGAQKDEEGNFGTFDTWPEIYGDEGDNGDGSES